MDNCSNCKFLKTDEKDAPCCCCIEGNIMKNWTPNKPTVKENLTVQKWRPEDWTNPYFTKIVKEVIPPLRPIKEYDAFEAGADAMLEALRNKGVHHVKGVTEPATYRNGEELKPKYTPEESCCVVFIPDDEVKS